jgi:hypothetical protein
MARFLKNTPLVPESNLAASLPSVPSSAYGDPPFTGLIRFNQATNRIEYYSSNILDGVAMGWTALAVQGTVQPYVESPGVGNGTQTQFTMNQSEYAADAIMVFVGGVYQQPTVSYTVSGAQLNFTTAPPSASSPQNTIIVIHNIFSTTAIPQNQVALALN